jgi:hypothetical protein
VGDDGRPEVVTSGWPPTSVWERFAAWILDTFKDEPARPTEGQR